MRHSVRFSSLIFGIASTLALGAADAPVKLATSDYNETDRLTEDLGEDSAILYTETAKVGKERVWQNQVLVDWQSCTVRYLDESPETISVELCEPYKELKFSVNRGHDRSYWSETHVVFNQNHAVGHTIDRWGVRGSSVWRVN